MAKNINGWWFSDNDVGPSTWAECEWGEPILNSEMFKIIEKEFKDKPRICAIDIGANIGYVTSWLSKRWEKVISFEPTPSTFECLRLNCSRPNIDLFNKGLSNKTGSLLMAVSDKKPDQNQFISDESKLRKHWNIAEIPVTTLDHYNFDCDFIKIDVEGHEFQVIEGSINTINRCRPGIMIEISYEGKILDHDISSKHKETISILEKLNYKVVWQHKHDWFLLPK